METKYENINSILMIIILFWDKSKKHVCNKKLDIAFIFLKQSLQRKSFAFH